MMNNYNSSNMNNTRSTQSLCNPPTINTSNYNKSQPEQYGPQKREGTPNSGRRCPLAYCDIADGSVLSPEEADRSWPSLAAANPRKVRHGKSPILAESTPAAPPRANPHKTEISKVVKTDFSAQPSNTALSGSTDSSATSLLGSCKALPYAQRWKPVALSPTDVDQVFKDLAVPDPTPPVQCENNNWKLGRRSTASDPNRLSSNSNNSNATAAKQGQPVQQQHVQNPVAAAPEYCNKNKLDDKEYPALVASMKRNGPAPQPVNVWNVISGSEIVKSRGNIAKEKTPPPVAAQASQLNFAAAVKQQVIANEAPKEDLETETTFKSTVLSPTIIATARRISVSPKSSSTDVACNTKPRPTANAPVTAPLYFQNTTKKNYQLPSWIGGRSMLNKPMSDVNEVFESSRLTRQMPAMNMGRDASTSQMNSFWPDRYSNARTSQVLNPDKETPTYFSKPSQQ